ncbi:metallophosphoesterase [Clostridium estertheticum]|uniref:metallophosphoesterase n=1 Tax=Clostridium estertheticum TaxID=238834 RepID=UPI0013E91AB7|nr:metallophosphoesterase [Clostridium estertheticum]MBZ9689005.1 metallophosphoesterase [Clostridium estertheticum]
MRIGVISDTHRNASCIEQLAGKIKELDVMIHLGDNVDDILTIEKYYKGRIINVKGNCDFSTSTPYDRVEDICGKRIFLTHGHRYNVKESLLKLSYKATETGADIVLYGHTHIGKIDFEEGVWYINPGSASEPRDGAPSFAIIDILGESIQPNLIRF